MCDRISSVCRSAYLELRRIGSIRPFLTVEAAAELARSRILSRSNYCSSLLAGITSEQLVRLQKYKTTLPDWPSVRNIMSMSRLLEETPLASCFRAHCLQSGNSFIPLFWWHITTLLLLLSVLILILRVSSFFLSETCDRLKGQSGKCWCTIFLIPGSTHLEFTTFENPPLLVFAIF